MRPLQYSTIIGSNPVWAHDEASGFNQLPNGAVIKASSVTLVNGYRPMQSGTMVGRTANQKQFSVIPANASALTSTNATTLTVAATSAGTTITVENADGFAGGDAITVGGTAATIAANGVNTSTGVITLTAALGANVAVGGAVVLAAAAAITEMYLAFTDIIDANVSRDFTLFRPQRMVYQNMLPQWSTMSTFMKGELAKRYQLINALN